MTTAADIISLALKDAGVIAAGETATAEDATDALATLNHLIAEWQVIPAYVPVTPYVLEALPGLATVLNLPTMYEPALRFSLAEMLTTTFSLPPRPDIMAFAARARKIVRRKNLVIPELKMPAGIPYSFRFGFYNEGG